MGFSDELSLVLIQGDAKPSCSGFLIADFLPLSTLSVDFFTNINFQTLINVCEGQKALYNTSCNCAQLPSSCRDNRFSGLASCSAYLPKIASRTDCVFGNAPATVTAPGSIVGRKRRSEW
ncbi:uncharacterized protein LOC101857713 [Aplysia californica]|uniref:Uncharacterized protein LOC101857713 n=1 Tax=Aplysia californica TaxID=6500 RepID=A0ABM1VRN9_APLCA|nr:uncharacterized protein LOC101857713 [Aplysia californica]